MRARHERLRVLPIAAISVALAAGSGGFVGGVGGATWWFLAALAVLLLIGAVLYWSGARVVAQSVHPDSEARTGRLAWRGVIALVAVASAVALAWLVIQREPLPIMSFHTATLLTTVSCALAIVGVLYLHRLPLVSFPALFMGTMFFITCGPLILFQIKGTDAFRFWKLLDLDSVALGMPIVMLAFASLVIGALLVPLRAIPPLAVGPEQRVRNHVPTLRWVGIALYAVSVLAVLLYTARGGALTYAFDEGYRGFSTARKSDSHSQLVTGSLAILLPWSLLVLAATSTTRRRLAQTVALSLPGIGLMLLAGDRGAFLTTMLLMAAAATLLGYRLGFKRSLVLFGIVAILFTTVATLRKTPVSEWDADIVSRSVTNDVEGSPTYEENFLEAFLVRTANSYQTLMGTVMEVPVNEDFRYGRDYLESLFTAVPFTDPPQSFLGVDLSEPEPSNWMKAIINPDGIAGQGYLQVAEAYLEFGAVGVIVLYVLLGWAIVSLWAHYATRPLDPRALAFGLIVMKASLIWIRNDVGSVGRTIVWGVLLVYAAPWAIDRVRGRLPGRRAGIDAAGDADRAVAGAGAARGL